MKASEDYSKAVEFVKKHGLNKAIFFVNKATDLYGGVTDLHYISYDCIKVLVPHLVRDSDTNIKDLKRLVESHELVEKWGGLDNAISCRFRVRFADIEDLKRLKQAILDVESCK